MNMAGLEHWPCMRFQKQKISILSKEKLLTRRSESIPSKSLTHKTYLVCVNSSDSPVHHRYNMLSSNKQTQGQMQWEVQWLSGAKLRKVITEYSGELGLILGLERVKSICDTNCKEFEIRKVLWWTWAMVEWQSQGGDKWSVHHDPKWVSLCRTSANCNFKTLVLQSMSDCQNSSPAIEVQLPEH